LSFGSLAGHQFIRPPGAERGSGAPAIRHKRRAHGNEAGIFLAGADAMYADMGHIGRNPIRMSWYGIVLSALLLNYAGQVALFFADPAMSGNPFFQLAPSWSIYPIVGLATVATIIASQAIITGAFSLTR
jgi:KUP system potassium uptake protein